MLCVFDCCVTSLRRWQLAYCITIQQNKRRESFLDSISITRHFSWLLLYLNENVGVFKGGKCYSGIGWMSHLVFLLLFSKVVHLCFSFISPPLPFQLIMFWEKRNKARRAPCFVGMCIHITVLSVCAVLCIAAHCAESMGVCRVIFLGCWAPQRP